MPAQTLEHIQAQNELALVNYDTPMARLPIEARVDQIKSQRDQDVFTRLKGLVALSHETDEIPPVLVSAIDDSAELALVKIDDEDSYGIESVGIGDISALVDAAIVTGHKNLAEKALQVVMSDTGSHKFDSDVREAIELSVHDDLNFTEAFNAIRELHGLEEIPFTVKRPHGTHGTPLSPEEEAMYKWIYRKD